MLEWQTADVTEWSLVLPNPFWHPCGVARKSKPPVPPEILAGFRILERFLDVLRPLDARRAKDPREFDPRRKFDAQGYFVMMLFTLLNPVIGSMRGLCAVSKSRRFAEGTGLPPVSLGSFSEAQAVFDPEVLRGVLRELLSRGGGNLPAGLRDKLGDTAVEAIDSTVWEAVGRMEWAGWREQHSTRQNAVRLHLRWRIFGPGCGGAEVTPGRECERRVLRHDLLEPGVMYVGDRNYSGDYGLLRRIGEIGADFIVRLQDKSVIHELEQLPVSARERAGSITHHVRVALGERGAKDEGWRLVRLQRPGGENVMILTNVAAGRLSALELCGIYRQRWKIEGFFRWLKCVLPCRHWLAEGPRGVAVQVYCALIAALLLAAHNGKLPGKRAMEGIRLWMLGWLDDDELAAWPGIAKKG